MDYFEYRSGELFAEGVPVRRIAREVGTPAYIYSLATLKRHYRVFDQAFARLSHLVCFSMKSNSNLAVLRAFVKEGGGFDIVSAGELFRALKAGADPKKIVFSGVGKKKAEIEYALNAGILMFNVESEQELTVLNEVARGVEKKAPISLRVNPDVDPKTHPYISTGMKKSKFGIDIKRSLEVYKRALSLTHLEVIGVDCHIGSQLTTIPPFVDALSRVKVFVEALRKEGARIRYLDLGGGLGIRYKDEEPPHPEEYAGALIQGLRGLDVTLILEPGRVVVGNAGILVTEVLYLKEGEEKTFVIVDGGMNDLIRPALYGSYQAIRPVVEGKGEMIVADVVGPICESGDFFAKDREIPRPQEGDLLAVMSAGAYGFTMSSNYNSRPRAPEILVDGDNFHVVRKRESFEDLISGETIPPILQ
ncbi:MAG: diaminopimelate decarboxylase [Deltaproteobacteria bacterium RIFCSPLOWO2_02_56_12]|nr:MAG: diaminopimelate decarboxylase [Deltaproteobacteria bacterium RIFCSPLOWO2_02_56_12]HBA40954.1 diaminopimelate decarboxylase [Deltaproteobacteria bacterium]